MTMILLDGKKARDARRETLVQMVRENGVVPTLAIIQVGNNPDSTLYIEQKKKFAKKIGALTIHLTFQENVSFETLSREVQRLNVDDKVHGIIVQLPLPKSLKKDDIIALIHPLKDVDGLTDENQNLLMEGRPRFIPATARGIISLLDFYHIPIKGKRVAVLGRSRLVGGPTACAMKARGGDITVCHSQTTNTRDITKASDIVVVAIGKPELINASYIKEGAVVVDVGINIAESEKSRVKSRKLEEEIPRRHMVGDVKFSEVSPIVSAISPVPGGVGPMTVLSLFENLLDATKFSLAH